MAINFLSGIDVDNGVLYTDTTNNRVGIGTTSPGHKLHVEGTVRADSSGTSGWAFMGRNNLNTALSGIWFENGDGELLLRDDANNLNVRLRSDSDSYFNGGNVGIGTTSPSSKLQVNGDLTVGDDSTVGSFINVIAAGASQDAGIRFGSESNTDSKAAIYTNTSNSDLHFDVTETTRMLIDSATGNVGIGTTSPQEKLHVQNYTTGESHQAMFKGGAVTVGDYSYISLNNGYSTEYNKEVRLAAVSEQSNSNKTGFAILTSPDANGASGHERLRVTADGNVGIGTTNPGHELVVQGTSSPNIELKNSNYSNGGFVLNRTNYTQQWKWWAEFNHMYFGYATDETNYSNKLTIQSGGNVGIGTTSPQAKLHVANGALRTWTPTSGTSAIFESTANSRSFVTITGANESELWFGDGTTQAKGRVRYENNNNMMEFWTNASPRMYINSAGNVGIGTTSPTSLLTLESNNTNPYPRIDIKSTSYYPGSEIRFLNSAGNEVSSIESYNNPGIQHLKLQYNASSSGGKLELQDNSAILGAGTSAVQSYLQVGVTDFRVITNYGTRMYINTLGNVGIGTSTPLYLLDAAGTIRCTSLIQTSQSDKKENISDIDKSKPRAIPFKEYRYKSDIDSTGRKRYGVLAEDIENDYPELVYVDSNGDKAVNYIDLLVKRVAELEKELEDISLTPGPKGSTGATGPQGPEGPAGKDGQGSSTTVFGCKGETIGTLGNITICEDHVRYEILDPKEGKPIDTLIMPRIQK